MSIRASPCLRRSSAPSELVFWIIDGGELPSHAGIVRDRALSVTTPFAGTVGQVWQDPCAQASSRRHSAGSVAHRRTPAYRRAAVWPAHADTRRTSIQITAAPARVSNAGKASRRTRPRRAEAVSHVKVGLADRRWMTMAVAPAFRCPFKTSCPGPSNTGAPSMCFAHNTPGRDSAVTTPSQQRSDAPRIEGSSTRRRAGIKPGLEFLRQVVMGNAFGRKSTIRLA